MRSADRCAGPSHGTDGGSVWIWIVLGLLVLGVIAALTLPEFIVVVTKENEAPFIGALRSISSVQAQFREGDREKDGHLDYATSLVELSLVGLIDGELGSGMKGGYLFSLSGGTYEWQCSATPVNEQVSGRNSIVCTDGVVRFAVSPTRADCNSPPME